jgi:hypothetical protein
VIWITNEDIAVLLTILKGEKMEKYGVDKSSVKDGIEKVAHEKIIAKVWNEIKQGGKDGKTKKDKSDRSQDGGDSKSASSNGLD